MEYLLLFGACTFFSLQFVFQKLFERRAREGVAVCLWNIAVSGAVAVLFLIAKSGLPEDMNGTSFLIAALYAASGLICSVASISAMNCGSVAGVGIFCLAGGMILPFLYGVFALSESSGLFKWLGMLLLTVSLFPAVMTKNGEERTGKRLRYAVLCSAVFLTNGLVSIFSKMHQISPRAVDEDSFVLTGALLRCGAAVLLMLFLAAASNRKRGTRPFREMFIEIGREPMTRRLFLVLLLSAAAYSVMNTLGNLLSLRCMNLMEASVQFPLLSATVTVLTALFGAVFFREKLRAGTIVSLLLTVAGAVLVAVQPF
ncbi:MAG: hypothetical protein E7576_12780 [Ruminococcaceae bacterium]|jgi:drug/metabolite transporter (DMT)-like permease|nr:hypothetical protein [Oscillospiraceae bacterium]